MWHCVPEAGVCQCTGLGCIPPVVTQLVSPGRYSYCHPTLRKSQYINLSTAVA